MGLNYNTNMRQYEHYDICFDFWLNFGYVNLKYQNRIEERKKKTGPNFRFKKSFLWLIVFICRLRYFNNCKAL